MGNLSSMVALKPPRAARAKKEAVGEKRKKSLSPVHESLPEVEVAVAKPAVLKKSRYRKKNSDTPKEQGVVIREGPLEAFRSPLVPAGDKGKEVMREPSP